MNPLLLPSNVLVVVCNPQSSALCALSMEGTLTHENKPLALVYDGLAAVIQYSPEDTLYYTNPINCVHTTLAEGMTLDQLAASYKNGIDILKEYMTKQPERISVSDSSVSKAVYAMLDDPKHISNIIHAPEGAECYSTRTESYFSSPSKVWNKAEEKWEALHRPVSESLYDDMCLVEYEGLKQLASLLDTSDVNPPQILKAYFL